MNDSPPSFEASIPRGHAERMLLWVQSSLKFGQPIDPFIMLAIQQLGHAERVLLAMEAELAGKLPTGSRAILDHGVKLMECSALSQYWVFGLYEMMRSAKQATTVLFVPVQALFQKVEVARMPLAKHEVKRTPGYYNVSHYPTGLWSPETGQVGWHAFDPFQKQNVVVTRTNLADEFLFLTALGTG